MRTTLELTAPLMFPLPTKIVRGRKGSREEQEWNSQTDGHGERDASLVRPFDIIRNPRTTKDEHMFLMNDGGCSHSIG